MLMSDSTPSIFGRAANLDQPKALGEKERSAGQIYVPEVEFMATRQMCDVPSIFGREPRDSDLAWKSM